MKGTCMFKLIVIGLLLSIISTIIDFFFEIPYSLLTGISLGIIILIVKFEKDYLQD